MEAGGVGAEPLRLQFNNLHLASEQTVRERTSD